MTNVLPSRSLKMAKMPQIAGRFGSLCAPNRGSVGEFALAEVVAAGSCF